MTSCRRHHSSCLLFTAAILTLFLAAGCKPGPTTIVGSVSYLNTATMNRPFPPAGHSGTVVDDVAYARLVDDSGTGSTIWESAAFDAGTVLTALTSGLTTDDGAYINSFVITLTDAQITGATLPLRLEVFLYDVPVIGTFPILDPGTDLDLYSYFDATGEGDPQWFSLINIQAHDVKRSNLYATVPIP